VKLVADRNDGGDTGRLLGHNEVEPMNLTPEFAKMHLDDAALAEVCRRYSVKELSLFGSAVRGEMRPESDIDMMVEFEPGVRVGLIKFESFAEELEALAGRRVDLVTRRGLKPWVRPAVLKDVRVIYAA
jgi:predicted nucleotidyltransferase